MHIPNSFQQNDIEKCHALIQSKPLATLTYLTESSITIDHIPMYLRTTQGELGTLVGHVSRANTLWQTASTSSNTIAIFHGENAYISPSFYVSKQHDNKVVPTWNYAAVHAHGNLRFIDDKQWLLEHLHELVDQQEAKLTNPWQISDAPSAFIDKLSSAIIGIELPISKIEAKFKLGQNRTPSDQLSTVNALRKLGDNQAVALAAFTEQNFTK